MGFPERQFAEAAIGDIVEDFFANGCVLLRNFVDIARALQVLDLTQRLYREVGKAHVFEQDLLDREYPRLSAYLFEEPHWQLLRSIFGSYDFQVNDGGTHARRVSPPGAQEGWQTPLGYHLDAMVHSFEFTINFWIPLRACGVEAPSLAVVPAPFGEIMEFTGFDGEPPENYGPEDLGEGAWFSHHFDPLIRAAASGEATANARIRKHFGERLWEPSYQVGDAMMLSNWTLHGTHATTAMTQSRENVELRFSTTASLFEIAGTRASSGLLPISHTWAGSRRKSARSSR